MHSLGDSPPRPPTPRHSRTMHPIESIRRHGGVASLTELRMDGATDYARKVALREGSLHRVRNGWFALPDAPGDTVRAVRVGGRLTCASLLATHGLWVMPDDRLHVAVPRNAARLRSPEAPRERLTLNDPSVVVHWNQFAWSPPRHECHDSLSAAVAHLILCRPRASAITTIDSALNSRLITRTQLRGILNQLPGTHAAIDRLVDGRAQSGLETLARLRLGSRRIRTRIQVDIPQVGRVDALIGDRLILELDSRTHHLGENYERDRTRDLNAIARGYIVLRVSYHRVMYDWDSIEQVVVALVRRGDHEWSAAHRRLGLAPAR